MSEIVDLPDDVEVHLHPYFKGRLPLAVARKVQACLNDGEAKAQAAVKAVQDELASLRRDYTACAQELAEIKKGRWPLLDKAEANHRYFEALSVQLAGERDAAKRESQAQFSKLTAELKQQGKTLLELEDNIRERAVERERLKREVKRLKAKLATAEAMPKRRVNAPNWARLARSIG